MNDQNQPAGASQPDQTQRLEAELATPPPLRHSEPVSADQLHAEAKDRAAQRPILQKILGLFRKEKSSFREQIGRAHV